MGVIGYNIGTRSWRSQVVMKRLTLVTLLVSAVWPMLTGPAVAASGPWDSNDHVAMRLVSAVHGVGERGSVPLGLHFRMKPGWKIYWRSPGDAGYPPKPDWTGSRNLARVTIRWPAPTRFSIFGLETLGYQDEVILPLSAELIVPGAAMTIAATVDYLTCKDVCIPYRATASLSLADAPASPTDLAFEIDRFSQRVPGPGARHGLTLDRATLAPSGDGVRLQVDASAIEPFVAPDVFVEGPEGSFFGRPEVEIADQGQTARLVIAGGGIDAAGSGDVPLTLTLVDGGRAMEQVVRVRLDPSQAAVAAPPPARTGAASGAHSLALILGLALLGGLILNLMPCVLPVLSIKLLSVVGHGGGTAAQVRRGFLASAAGILFSFAVLAAILVGLQAAGVSIGWGIQFQQPVFMVAMTVIVTLFACNLFGLFEIALPHRIAQIAGTAGDSHSLAGHFAMGAFATLLATPCSAPFLGTAVGFALSRGPLEIFGIFLVLGVGLALPYLLIAAVPALATRLPRPGAWMVWLRRALGVALLATAAWLISVIAIQVGAHGAVSVALLMGLVVAVLGLRRLPESRLGRHAGKAVAVLSIAAIAVAIVHEPERLPAPATTATALWRPFDPGELRRLTAAGKVVFVDVTADWCLTCKVNKTLVLDSAPVADWLSRPNVVAMRADWTRPNAAIAAYLASFGRYGIPFNAVYGPAAPDGVVLPELLSARAVLEAAAQAGADSGVARR